MNNEECLICREKLVYLNNEELMKCVLCNKEYYSKTKCRNGHFVCDDCHTRGLDRIVSACLNSNSRNPIEVLRNLMSMDFCHMHGPEHHTLVGASLITAYYNSGGRIDLKEALLEMLKRGKQVPGGACGFWGACGAGISTGMFVSIITDCTPLKNKEWGLANRMTSRSLERIGNVGGPRCCKRNSYLSIIAAVEFVREELGIEMDVTRVVCDSYMKNNQCIGKRCPFRKDM